MLNKPSVKYFWEGVYFDIKGVNRLTARFCKLAGLWSSVRATTTRLLNPAPIGEMTSATGKRCFYDDCIKYPSFGVEGTKTAIFCSKHAVVGMVDVKSKRCSREGCYTYPAYGWRGSTKAEYCAKHADQGMVNVKSKMCWHESCSTQASHGWEGTTKAEFCAKHANAGMTNVVRKRCSHEGCSTHPSHGLEGTRKPRFCSKHAGEGMVDVVSKKCFHEGCTKSPSFGFQGTMKAKFCATHAEHGMVDVKRKRCAYDDCSTNPSFGWNGSKKAEFCAKHAEEGMVNVRKNKYDHRPREEKQVIGAHDESPGVRDWWQGGEGPGVGVVEKARDGESAVPSHSRGVANGRDNCATKRARVWSPTLGATRKSGVVIQLFHRDSHVTPHHAQLGSLRCRLERLGAT